MKIITLTLNPAFDLHCFTESFKPYHESIVKVTSRDAGGKGINISRALSESGYDNLALVVLGRENGAEFEERLNNDGVSYKAVYTDGRIRENLTLHERFNPETRISFEGFTANECLLSEIKNMIVNDLSDTVITFTGSYPKGLEKDSVKELLISLKERGAKLVIDSRSLSLEDIFEIKPWLIKPNKDEAESYSGEKIDSVDSAKKIAERFCLSGVENVLLSLGDEGAVLATQNGAIYKKSPDIKVTSTIGAGDSMIAGFISAVIDGKGEEDCLKRAIAFGSSACLREGTLPPLKEDIDKLYATIE